MRIVERDAAGGGECDNKALLIAYLYGEITPEERRVFEEHLAACVACTDEVQALGDVRTQLADWQAPEIELGFRVTRDPVLRPRRWWQATMPVWAQAAAAVLVLSAGAALANLQIDYGSNGLRVRTGWHENTVAAAAAVTTVPTRAAAPAPGIDLAAVRALVGESEQRLRAELVADRARTAPAAVAASSRDGVTSEAMLRQVRALLDDSERRQEHQLALRLAQTIRDVDTQRRADLVRIEQTMGTLEGVTGQEAASLREQMNYLVRVSQRR